MPQVTQVKFTSVESPFQMIEIGYPVYGECFDCKHNCLGVDEPSELWNVPTKSVKFGQMRWHVLVNKIGNLSVRFTRRLNLSTKRFHKIKESFLSQQFSWKINFKVRTRRILTSRVRFHNSIGKAASVLITGYSFLHS